MAGPTASARASLEAVVRGRVQGVGFRYFVLDRAIRLGLVGWVANEPDGSVRCLAEGRRADLETLLGALGRGPLGGRVDDVQANWGPAHGTFAQFTVRAGGHSGD
ncbi:MAG TPA: acylphosphatase [Candidatus Limnocylindrales bacterium]